MIVHDFLANVVHEMTQNIPIVTNCTTMAGFTKDLQKMLMRYPLSNVAWNFSVTMRFLNHYGLPV
jgi:hypothetical protein